MDDASQHTVDARAQPFEATARGLDPCLNYRDAKAAIRWLCDAFGCSEQMVHPGEDREVAHAQLSLGPGIIMLGSAGDEMPEGDVWSFGTYHPTATAG